jgi:hypothetical protein
MRNAIAIVLVVAGLLWLGSLLGSCVERLSERAKDAGGFVGCAYNPETNE